MSAGGARWRSRASAAEPRWNYCIYISDRRREPIQLPLLDNAKVKRNGNYGVALWEHRRGGASPFPASPPLVSKHAAEQPHFPRREDDRAFDKSYSLFTSIVRSKMSNLPHHNNSLPPPYRSAGITCSHNAADEMFRLPDSGMPPITSAQPGGRLFTSRQNDVLQIRPSTTLCFCLFCRRLRPLKKKAPLRFVLRAQKAPLAIERFHTQHKHGSLVKAAILLI